MNHPIWEEISEGAKQLIHKMLTSDYKKRPFAKDILNDKWFESAPKQKIDKKLMSEALESIKAFRYSSKLQQCTMSMMVQQMVSKDEEARLKKIFTQLDDDGNGFLEYNELLTGLTRIYGKEYAEKEVKRIFDLVDQDHSGQIDFSEYMQASVNKENLLKPEKLKASFDFYDKDGSGNISLDEFKEVLGVGKNINPDVWQKMVTEIDQDGDGEINL